MKKIFPVIVVLIALSIAGLIVIQVQWVSNLLVVQGERFLYKVDRAGVSVSEQIGKQTLAGRMMRLQRKRDLAFPNDLTFGITRMPTIAERYTQQDIDSALRHAFDREELKNFRFEFAVTSNASDFRAVELQSPDFFKELMDTVHNRREEIAIVPESGTDLEGLMAYEHLILIIPDFKTQVWRSITWVIIGAVLFNIIIIAAFYLAVKTILNQRKLNAIKSDFINNMTHELKTPLATISLATDALKNEKVLADRSKLEYFSGIIKDENKRMSKHVETILQAGLMDRQDIRMNIKSIHVHELIQTVLDNFSLQMQEKGAATTLQLNAKDDNINADEAHFTNLISNLIDNAIKYSKEKDPLQLKITTHSTPKFLVIQFEDNGIGMSKETVKRIFEKFYRAHTGNIHNVKGFGLGMSYVKTVVDMHKGRVRVDSTLGKGSTFTLEMPLGDNA
ncbi:HAMP domain-containing histidine kinase [Panacibacter sp. DH6]|uniref:histidine kinase n=1 Tax=Panacibacter microcysteis TaxID=2793269 RepID=A0A931GST8_9BACT|nr:HAMP domain-containing sensor histidine kinase [Panacibacter microcysteis]MBG9374786.1 HAMP domain-containing histidine kinase [Panacibacter microcysteis]